VLGFLCAYLGTVLLSGTIAMLPRYWIAVIPAVLVSLPPAAIPSESTADRKWRILVVAGLAVLVLFSIVNRRGDFYPLPDHSFYVVAERSTRAQELLQLHIEATRHLAAIGVPILAGWPEYFRLVYPEMGYVRQSPDDVISGIDGWPTELPDSFALLIEVGYGNPRSDLADMIEAKGYELITETLRVGGFESEVIVASR
jgi:hypothetical protein